jgi:hypothetical protein
MLMKQRLRRRKGGVLVKGTRAAPALGFFFNGHYKNP